MSPTKDKTAESPRLTTIPNHIRQSISKVGDHHTSVDKDKNISMKHIRDQSFGYPNSNATDKLQHANFNANQNGQPCIQDDFNLNRENVMTFAEVTDNIKVKEATTGENLNIEPMRPLLRGYCSTLTLPGRQRGPYNRVPAEGDYCEISLANG